MTMLYSELLFEGLGRSFLSYPGAKDVGIEFNFYQNLCLLVLELDLVVGNKAIIEQFKTSKSNMDYGMFIPIQLAAIGKPLLVNKIVIKQERLSIMASRYLLNVSRNY